VPAKRKIKMLIEKILKNIQMVTAVMALTLGLLLLFSISAEDSGKGYEKWHSGNVSTTTTP
jgi:TM2 domain-containing membrane protein YozV